MTSAAVAGLGLARAAASWHDLGILGERQRLLSSLLHMHLGLTTGREGRPNTRGQS
jgi:hypothetical protein